MRKFKDQFFLGILIISTLFTVSLLFGIIAYVFAKGFRYVNLTFLSSVSSALKGTVGIAGNILNTLLLVLMTLLIAVPLGIGSAIYLNEYAKKGTLVSVVEFATETLSGIPSIIFGLFGMLFFGEKLGFGYSLLTGSLTLILMILPLITRNTQEALKTVPKAYREGAYGLGSGKWQMIRTVLLPCALPGIMTGIMLAIGRIVGESAALLFTAGSARYLPNSLSGLLKKPLLPGGTLTIQMYLSATSEGDFNTAFAIAVVLLVVVLLINLTAHLLTKKTKE